MKVRFRSWADFSYGGLWQFSILPHIDVYYGGALCIAVGWGFWQGELWFGMDGDLI